MSLKVALKGQLHSDEISATNYVFPKGNDKWASALGSDPGRTMQLLGISGADKDCYTIAVTSEGLIYAYRKMLPRRGDCAMVMMLADGPTNNAARLKEKLVDILEYGLKEPSSSNINDVIIQEKINSCEGLFYSDRKTNPLTINDGAPEDSSRGESYRTYKSEEELFKLLENPYQRAYSKYSCVHVVSADVVAANISMAGKMECINTPFERTFFFELPAGVLVKKDLNHVNEGMLFTLQYTRSGYNTVEIPDLRVPYSSKYFKLEKDTIVVKSAEECNIVFKRTITISLNSDGKPVNNARLRYDNREYVSENGEIKLDMPDVQVTLLIRAAGFIDKEVNIDTKRRQFYDISLKNKGLTKKVYFEPVWSKQKKSSDSTQDELCTVSFSCNTKMYNAFQDEMDPEKVDTPSFYVSKQSPQRRVVIAFVLALFLGMGIGAVVGHYVWGSENVESTENNESTSEEHDKGENTSAETNSIQTPLELTKEQKENADKEYLSINNVWVRDSLKSVKYIYFFDSILQNNIKWTDVDLSDYPIENFYWKKYTNMYNTNKSFFTKSLREQVQNQIKVDSVLHWEKINFEEYSSPSNNEQRLERPANR